MIDPLAEDAGGNEACLGGRDGDPGYHRVTCREDVSVQSLPREHEGRRDHEACSRGAANDRRMESCLGCVCPRVARSLDAHDVLNFPRFCKHGLLEIEAAVGANPMINDGAHSDQTTTSHCRE